MIIDAINNLPFWMQIILAILSCAIVSSFVYLILCIAKRNIKYKGLEIESQKGYITGEQVIDYISKNNDAQDRKNIIRYRLKPRDQLKFVKQQNDYIKEIMQKKYNELLDRRELGAWEKNQFFKAYENVVDFMLIKQTEICMEYFDSIAGSIKDIDITELENPASEINKIIADQSMWMIRKGSEILDRYFIELSGITRGELMKENQSIVAEILKRIEMALKTGHKIHYDFKIKLHKIDLEMDKNKDILLRKQGG